MSDLRKNVKTFFVCGDQVLGGRKVAEHLYSLGHRRFAVLTGLEVSKDGQLRLQGFQSYLKSKNISLDPKRIVRADYREDMAYEKVAEVLNPPHKPTAIFCLNDQMAFGVLRKLKDLKIDCPRGISVVGYDNDPRGELYSPALTTVNVPLYHLAQEAARKLISHLKSKASKRAFIGHVSCPVDLVVRDSTQSPPK